MENYRHDKDKFALFEALYHDLRKDYPAQFPVRSLKSRMALVDKQYGYENLGLQW
jgi:HD superfamily phosphohydrolase YqeK